MKPLRIILANAAKSQKTIVLSEGTDARTVEAAREARAREGGQVELRSRKDVQRTPHFHQLRMLGEAEPIVRRRGEEFLRCVLHSVLLEQVVVIIGCNSAEPRH